MDVHSLQVNIVALTAIVLSLMCSATISSGINVTAMIIAPYVTAEFACTGPYNEFPPTLLLNGTGALTVADCYNSTLTETGDGNATATLIIHGNSACKTFSVSCRIFKESQFLYLHNTTLEIEGRLSSPESVRHVNSTTIEWNPPYQSVNNDVIHVYPHIIRYTVYITDIYTGNIIVKENVTEAQYTFNTQDDGLCLIYQVSAWNAGGEGEKSQPVQESTIQVPRNISARSVTAEVIGDLHIHIDDVDVVCLSRMPEFFLVTLMTPSGSVLNETTRQHQPGQIADFTISLPQTVDVCSLRVRIRAGNSAGMSSASEAVEVDCSGDSTDSTTTISADGGDNQLPEVLIVFAAVGGVVMVVAVVVTTCYKIYKNYEKRNSKGQSDNNSKSSTVGRQVLLSDISQQTTTTSRPEARDPESTAVWMQTMDSAPSTLRTGSSTESDHSNDHLLPQ